MADICVSNGVQWVYVQKGFSKPKIVSLSLHNYWRIQTRVYANVNYCTQLAAESIENIF